MPDDDYCFWHSPKYKEEADQARKLGGQRRRREKAVEGAYEVEGLDTVPRIRRWLEIAMLEALSLEQSVARVRAILAGVQVAARLLEVGEHEGRLAAIEAALGPRLQKPQRQKRGFWR